MGDDALLTIKNTIQHIEVGEDDLKRFTVAPDELLARGIRYIQRTQPWLDSNSDVIRELVFRRVLETVSGNSVEERLNKLEQILKGQCR